VRDNDSDSDGERPGGQVLAVGPGDGQGIIAVLPRGVDAAEVPRRGPPCGDRGPQLGAVRPLPRQLRRVRRALLPRARLGVQDRESRSTLYARPGSFVAGGSPGAEAQGGAAGAIAADATA